MSPKEFNLLIDKTFIKIEELSATKGSEYAAGSDRLENFKTNGLVFGVPPESVCGIFMDKHYRAIQSFIRTGIVYSEPIEGRIDDCILYLLLLKGIIKDKEVAQRIADSQSDPFKNIKHQTSQE